MSTLRPACSVRAMWVLFEYMVNTPTCALSGVFLVVILWSSNLDGNADLVLRYMSFVARAFTILFALRCRSLDFDWTPYGRFGKSVFTDSVIGLAGERRYQTADLHVSLLSPGPFGDERVVLQQHVARNFRPGWRAFV